MNEELYILFDQYLNDELSAEERRQFELRLFTDEDFKAEWELYQEMNSHIEDRIRHEHALNVLREVHKEQSVGRGQVIRFTLRKMVMIAASVILLGVVGYWGYGIYNNNIRVERIMAEQELPPSRGTRSIESASTKLDSAIYFFDLRAFDKSQELFIQILASNPENQEANFYMGYITFLDKEFISSKSYFERCDIEDVDVSNMLEVIDEIINY